MIRQGGAVRRRLSGASDKGSMGQGSRIEVCLFSRFSISVDGEFVNLHNTKAAELIAFLACERGRPVSKRRAAYAIWPNSSEAAAMQSMYKVLQHVHKLSYCGRKIPLITTRGEARLDVRKVTLDVIDFTRLYNSGEPEDWKRAIDLYRGILLFDSGYDWASEYEGEYDTGYYELLSRLEGYYTEIGNRNLALYYRRKFAE
jgi:two-component SAPR family response regulator